MTQEITVTKVEDHHEMQFGGDSAYPVPTYAIEQLDDEITPTEVGESVTFRGDYGGSKHMKNFDVEEVLDDEDATDDGSDEGSEEVAPVDERFDVGDCVENPSQRSGVEYQVVEVGDSEDIFGNAEKKLVVERADGRGTSDEIPEHYHENWRLA